VEVDPKAATLAARVMRRWAHAQGVTYEVTVSRYRGGHHVESAYPDVIGLSGAQLVDAHRPRRRKVRRRVKRLPRGRGWISLDDGPAFALEVARYLEMTGHGWAPTLHVAAPGPVSGLKYLFMAFSGPGL
jgi:hypothetical protein